MQPIHLEINLAGTLWDKGTDAVKVFQAISTAADATTKELDKTARSSEVLAISQKAISESKADLYLRQLSQNLKEGQDFSTAYANALKEVNAALNQTGAAAEKASSGFTQGYRTGREFSRVATEISFAAGQMGEVLGAGNDQMKIFAEGVRIAGYTIQSLPLGPVAVAISAITGAFALFTAIQRQQQEASHSGATELAQYTQQLDKLANPQPVEAISKLTGLTENQVRIWQQLATTSASAAGALLNLIKGDQDAAQAAQDAADKSNIFKVALGGIVEAAQAVAGFLGGVLNDALLGLRNSVIATVAAIAGAITFVDQLVKTGDAAKASSAAWDSLAQAIKFYTVGAAGSVGPTIDAGAAVTQLTSQINEAANASDKLWDAIHKVSQAQATLAKETAAADAELAKQEQSFNDDAAAAQSDANDKMIAARQQRDDRIGQIEEQLGQRISSINASLGAQEENLNFQRMQQEEQLTHDLIKEQQKYQEEIRKMITDTIQSLAKLDFTEHENLSKAKTAREQDDIKRKAVFDRAQIMASMDEHRKEIDFNHQQAVSDLGFKDMLNEQQYQHSMEMARKAAAEQKAEAGKAAAEQEAQAQKAETKQEAEIDKGLKKQLESISKQRTAAEQSHKEKLQQYQDEYDNVIKNITDETKFAMDKTNEIPRWITIDLILNTADLEDYANWIRAGNDPNKWSGLHGQMAQQPGSNEKYATGGIVPGPVGAPRLATVHGGEQIVPAHKVDQPTDKRAANIDLGDNKWMTPLMENMVQQLMDSGVIDKSIDVYLDNARIT